VDHPLSSVGRSPFGDLLGLGLSAGRLRVSGWPVGTLEQRLRKSLGKAEEYAVCMYACMQYARIDVWSVKHR